MPADTAPTPSTATVAEHSRRAEVDRLILPALRERARQSLTFLAGAQSVYAITLMFSQGPAVGQRALLNLVRLAVLLGCVWALRGEGSRQSTLRITAIGLGVQFATGVLISIVREDVLPMVLLVVVLSCISSVFIPWGGRVQALVCAAAAFGLVVASAFVYHATGQRLAFDPAATIACTLGVSIYIAYFLERSRRTLKARLAEARRTDEELAALRSQLERRVAERTAELEIANSELEGFSYTVSHDLRSPLRSIAGFSQVVLDESGDRLDESGRASLEKIRAASRHMDGLIDDMLLLARVGRSALRYETVDLSEIARSIGEQLTEENPERNVQLEVGTVPIIQGDNALLRIALDNLLRNAWKFTLTREVAHVRAYGETVDGNVVFSVGDDGIGFDMRFRSKLFQPFQRIHGDPRFPGTGVGLATVARIARRHGGSVDASGELGSGATFSIILPAARPR